MGRKKGRGARDLVDVVKQKWGAGDPSRWGIDDGQLQHSDQHEPVVDVQVRFMGEKTVSQGKRRAADARMFDSLTADQTKAFSRIRRGFSLTTNGFGCNGGFDEPEGGGAADMTEADRATWEALLRTAYWNWHTECVRRRLDAAVALDVIVYGYNLSECADARRIDRETVKRNLLNCLNLYCRQNGWNAENSEKADNDGWSAWFPWLIQWLKRA